MSLKASIRQHLHEEEEWRNRATGNDWTQFELLIDGKPVFAQIGACSWSGPSRELVVIVTLRKDAPGIESKRLTKPFDARNASKEEIVAEAREMATTWLNKNIGKLEDIAAKGKAKMDKIYRELEVDYAKQEKRDQAEFRKKKKGFTHVLTAWIHPPHGDDHQRQWFCKGEPSKAVIEKTIKQAGSVELGDYQLTPL